MKKAINVALKPFDWIMKLVAAILRMLGLGGGGAAGGNAVPRTPKAGKQDEAAAGSDPSRGLSPGQQLAMAMTILNYAGAEKSARKTVDLSEFPNVEKAFLMGCDDKTLESLSAMKPQEALNFVLEQTQKVRSQMTKPARKASRQEQESDRGYNVSGPSLGVALRMA